MKWTQWLTTWFGGSRKSLGATGIGLRAALGGGSPGGWASDHREETAHNTGFNYIAIHAIAAQVARATVTVFEDGDQSALRQSRRKSLALRVGSFSRWKSTYGADDRETDPVPTTHALVRLLRRPNPHESGASFRYRQAQQLRLTGTCLIWNVPSVSGPTCERYVIPTAMASPVAPTAELPRGGWRINPVASRYTPIVDDGYVDCPSWYRILGQIVDARQVQVIRLPHAWYLDDGQSPLSAGAKWVDAGEAVDAARFHQLKNGIDPSVVWNLPPDVSPDQDEMDRVQTKISAKYGGPENVGRVIVAQSGTSVTPLSVTPKDMCYAEGFQDFKAAVLALHQTPPVAVGLQEPGAYAAYNASMKAWRHAAIQPLCDLLAESETEHLALQFGQGLTVEIESDTVDDTDLIEQQLQNDLAAKVRTKNEWRAVRGMPPLPGTQGDELVGTDASRATGPVRQTPNSDPKSFDSDSTVDDTEPKSIRTSEQPPDDDELRLLSRSNTNHSVDPWVSKSSGSPSSPPTDDSESDKDHVAKNELARAELIAEILYGVYGESSLSLLDEFSEPRHKAFNPELHPRDERGRFSQRGSATAVAEAGRAISSVLRGETLSRSDPHVLNSLRVLTRSQLESLHREHGVSAPPRIRDRLVESVLVRLLRLPGQLDGDVSSLVSGHRRRTGKVEVDVQNAEETNRILGRTIERHQWSELIGAQPGSRVYVYPRGNRRVEIDIEHPDYWAQRTLTRHEIENVQFHVAPHRQGHGLGARILAEQVTTAASLGFERIRTDAIGVGEALRDGSHEPLSGYYAWARLGFDGDLGPLMDHRKRFGSPAEKASVAQFKFRFPDVTRVSEMMRTKERRDWWRKFGGEFEAQFDLGPDSISRHVLSGYLREKALELNKPRRSKSITRIPIESLDAVARTRSLVSPRTKADATDASQDQWRGSTIPNGELPDTLSPEDEKVLDRVWDEIGRDLGGARDLTSTF